MRQWPPSPANKSVVSRAGGVRLGPARRAVCGLIPSCVAKWEKVGYGGFSKWTGVAGLLPRRHFGPNSSPRGNLAFRGHYEHSLDAKNRLSIPARFRASFSSGVVLAKDPEPCLAIWPTQTHEAIIDRALSGLNPTP